MVLSHDPDLLVFVIGKGPAGAGLWQLTESLEMSQNVTFTGRLEHWRVALEAADIMCSLGVHAGFREETIHALGIGLAIVAPAEAVCDGLDDEQTALLFPAEDHVRMAEQIRRLLEDRALARRIAAAGQAYARANCSVARMVAEHVRIYRNLAHAATTITLPTMQ
jgi:glycosyltransferase involved in cell wall biosynthesis